MVSHKLDFFNALKEPPSSLLQDNGKTLSFGPVRLLLLLVVIQFSRIATYPTAMRREPDLLTHRAISRQLFSKQTLPFLRQIILVNWPASAKNACFRPHRRPSSILPPRRWRQSQAPRIRKDYYQLMPSSSK